MESINQEAGRARRWATCPRKEERTNHRQRLCWTLPCRPRPISPARPRSVQRKPRLAVTAVACVAGLTGSCVIGSPEADYVFDLALAGGQVVDELLDVDKKTIILLSFPVDCFSCSGLFGQCASFARSHGMDLKMILTEGPTTRQAASLAFFRVKIAGVLATRLPDTRTTAHIFDGRKRIRSAVGVSAQIAMLDELTMPSSNAGHHNPQHRRQAP